MSRFSRLAALLLVASCTASCLTISQRADAQQPTQPAATADNAGNQEWYYDQTTEQIEKKSVGRLKSEKRGEQRMARLEAMRWYGFSAGRPTAAAMPFTSMYSPAWSRPGGRPFAWYTGHRAPLTPRYVHYRYYR